MKPKKSLRKLLKNGAGFTVLGVLAFALDLSILVLLTEIAHMHYLYALTISFLSATSLHYLLARRLVFPRTTRSLSHGYLFFMTSAAFNLGLTLALMKIAVDHYDIYYVFARPTVSVIVGVWNFVVNTKFTFKERLLHD